ncbi:DUF4202 family protein [Thiocapsa rosea]|uniref:DUF4202 family protein n=1 Tax=Thiocapsa rosea TaxID=69360 RepID=UPI000EB38A4F
MGRALKIATTAIDPKDCKVENLVVRCSLHVRFKEGLKTNPNSQTMGDAVCLYFLEHEFAESAAKHDDVRVVGVVQKSWREMSERGHELALQLPLAGGAQVRVGRVLSGD